MDDRELEARLTERLRTRFDGAQPSASLRTEVAAVTVPRPRAAWRGPSVAWAAAAVVVLAVVVGVRMIALPSGAPPHDGRSPSPSPTQELSTSYAVLPSAGASPTKANTSQASDVFAARLRSIGLGTFTGGAGYAIFFTIATVDDQPAVRQVLSATGDLEIVGLAGAIPDTTSPETLVGKPVPGGTVPIAGPDDLDGAELTTDQNGEPALRLDLGAAAGDRLAAYTTDHVMSAMAIVVDGQVEMVPIVRSPISGRQVLISGVVSSRFDFIAAIATSGRLPSSWREPRVPVVIPEAEARRLALQVVPSSVPPRVAAIQLSTDGTPTALTPTWVVTVEGVAVDPCYGPASSCPTTQTTVDHWRVILDATTGGEIRTEIELR